MLNQKWYIIANPAAGKGKVKKKLPLIERLFRVNNLDYELVTTGRSGEGILLVKKAIQKGFRNILAIGGDGTNHEIVNGIMEQEIVPAESLTYSILSIGTGNDWIKTHGIPNDVKAFISMLKNGKTTLQDIGVVSFTKNDAIQKRYFVNIAGMAYDAFVVQKTAKQSGIFSNKLFYLISLMRYLFQYKLQQAKIEWNDQVLNGYFYTINVGICRFAGGGMEIVPHAVPDDGRLAITIAGHFSKLSVILNTYRFYNGTIAKLSKISTHRSTKISVDSLDKEPVPVEADGEFLGYTPVEFSVIPRALKILVP